MDLERLKRHYASLSDEALLEIDREELVQAACVVLDAEIAARGLDQEEGEEEEPPVSAPAAVDEDWLADAATAFAIAVDRQNERAPQMERACQVLEAAGIPHDVNVRQNEDDPQHPFTLDLLVPGRLVLEATSILDRDLLNEELEQGWRDHFAALSDGELNAVDIRILTAGWADRIDRLTRAYRDERAKRSG